VFTASEFALPDTIGHIDFIPAIFWCHLIAACSSIGGGCVTHPVITIEYLRRHLERSGVEEPAADSRISSAYLRPWRPSFLR